MIIRFNSDGFVVKTADIGTINEKAIILVDENGVPVVSAIGNQNPDFRVGITSNLTPQKLRVLYAVGLETRR